MIIQEVLAKLDSLANPDNVAGMARFGIKTDKTLGIALPALQKMARETGRDHILAGELWATGVHEARLLACFIDEPSRVTETQMECWVRDFDSWDICDQCCSHLFDKLPQGYAKAMEWSSRPEEFVRRAGYVMMAALSVHDKNAPDEKLAAFFPAIKAGAGDERNFVKKAVNWALRQIGKRNPALNKAAVACALEIQQMDSRSARWIAADALRELRSASVQQKLFGLT